MVMRSRRLNVRCSGVSRRRRARPGLGGVDTTGASDPGPRRRGGDGVAHAAVGYGSGQVVRRLA